jgi:hypothetical protein
MASYIVPFALVVRRKAYNEVTLHRMSLLSHVVSRC